MLERSGLLICDFEKVREEYMKNLETRYLERLSDLYPTIAAASTEIINLQAILNLPKGTEHFLTDVHGEYEAFAHVLKNGSGSVRRKIDDVFGNTMSIRDKRSLATLIYYPKQKMDMIKTTETNMGDWYRVHLYLLIEVSKRAASKYTRSKVRKALPKDFAYVIEELITEKAEVSDKESYYNEIISTIIRIGRAEDFIVAISELIQRLVVDHLHIVGDIYDRGPGPHIIMDKLMTYHSLDIQWGNHDVLWMGASVGQRGCIANVIRICARYGNLDILEDGYGINLLPLATFALKVYKDDPCTCFRLKVPDRPDTDEMQMNLRIHKAISIIQFKVEGQIIQRQKSFHLDNRALLHRIDYEKGTIELEGKEYKLLDTYFPTIDPEDPYMLTEEEEDIMERLEKAFTNCEKLQQHMRFLLAKGSLYKVYNDNLLYHGCVPLDQDGSLKETEVYGKKYRGRELYDTLDAYVRKGFFALDKKEREDGRDIMWYIWLHPDSPLFGKNKMATFERCILEDPETHIEKKDPNYFLIEKGIYEQLLTNPDEVVKGTVKELAEKYNIDVMTMVGFLDGINDSLKIKNPIEEMDENTEVTLAFDKELLYKNMVDAKADWLYNLPMWDEIFTPEQKKTLYMEQKKSGTIIKGKKIGRNDPCPCGSGKKYKYCCGR